MPAGVALTTRSKPAGIGLVGRRDLVTVPAKPRDQRVALLGIEIGERDARAFHRERQRDRRARAARADSAARAFLRIEAVALERVDEAAAVGHVAAPASVRGAPHHVAHFQHTRALRRRRRNGGTRPACAAP